MDEVRGQFAGGAERVPVIVQVRVRWRPEAALAAEEARRQRAEVDSAHERAARRAPAARVSRRFDGMPGRVLEVTWEELESLAVAPEVATLHPVVADTADDWASTPQVRGTQSQQIGWSGTGQNVAILDTGVARSHEYLGGRVVSEACFARKCVTVTFVTVRVGDCPNGQGTQTGTDAAAPCLAAGCDHGTHVAGIAADAELAA